MLRMDEISMREINGGRWKCKFCGKKYWLAITTITHSFFNHGLPFADWCWW